MDGITTIITWLGTGLEADLPDPADLDTLLSGGNINGAAHYYAYDTQIDRVLNRDSIAWDVIGGVGATGGITELDGDITAGPGTGLQTATIANDAVTEIKIIDGAVTNAKLADMPAQSFKANLTGSPDVPDDADIADVAAALAPYMPAAAFVATASKTADYAIDPAEVGTIFDTIGASADVTGSLPPSTPGMWYGFLVSTSDYHKALADGTETISIGDVTSSAGGYVRSNVPYSLLVIECHEAGAWVARSVTEEPTWEVDGTPIGGGGGGGGFTAVTKTGDYTITEDDSGTDFNNDAAGADIVLSLPAAVPNLIFAAAVHDAFYIKFLADGTDKIAEGTDNSSAGGYIRSNLPYSYIELRCHVAGQWVASTMTGSWGIDV